jgi:MoxR-like ATPase
MNEEDLGEMVVKAVRLKDEISKVMVGQDKVIIQVLSCLFAGGHALLEGVPGLGKTSLIRTLAASLGLPSSRIQFTPDLMPADILGTDVLVRDDENHTDIVFRKGPLFSSVVLADEINRATPKTQSALLEAMQEKAVTIGGKRYELEEPFIVLATQNPLEMEGTYPLPEAQMDRFHFKVVMDYPDRAEMAEIMTRTTGNDEPAASEVMSREEVMEIRQVVREIPVPAEVRDYAISLVMASHPGRGPEAVNRFVRYGASPRAAQALLLGAKTRAFLDGRFNASFDDIRESALPSLRHRLILSFEGEAEGQTTDALVAVLLKDIRP